ncbi:MAG: formate dehydrogenase accessory sulfurtransferase FdhD [Dermatophilus congolensis]|nr:formate dehydrogenase accessory sulfurtransferase FdhD [Dermatophilus congolensis]
MGRVTRRYPVVRVDSANPSGVRSVETVAVEEPLEIRVNGAPYSVTMRTPGHDVEMAHGLLASEGVIADAEDLRTARYCGGASRTPSLEPQVVAEGAAWLRDAWDAPETSRSNAVDSGQDSGHSHGHAHGRGIDLTGTPPASGASSQNTYNVLDIRLASEVTVPEQRRRSLVTSSACGVCGTATIELLRQHQTFDLRDDDVRVSADVLLALPETLRKHQATFARTGGLHAAGLFTATGETLVVREDVGRHNAVDKVVGWAMMNDLRPARGCVLMVSGRTSFELAQKAVLAGVPVLAGVSAPSSLAIDIATDAGLTLAGFVRDDRMNLYAAQERITPADA